MTSVEGRSLVNTLESEIQRVQNDLKGVDEKMRRLTGWDSSFSDNRPRERRLRVPSASMDEEPPAKRRSFGGVFARLGGAVLEGRSREQRGRGDNERGSFRGGGRGGFRDRDRRMEEHMEMLDDDDDGTPKPSIPSSVIRPVIDTKSRTEAAAELTKDRASRDRNRRMFGSLIGTLQRFRNDEAKQKDKDEQRAAIDRKLEEKGKAEQEEIRREKQILFNRRKEDQARIHRLKMKMARLKEHEKWVEHQMKLTNFIRTKTKPSIFWLPQIQTSKTNKMISATKETIEGEVEEQKQRMKDDLEQIVGKNQMDEDRAGTDEDDESSEDMGVNTVRARNHRGMLGREELLQRRQDLLDYEPEEGELVYEKTDLIVKTGKIDSPGKRMVVQVASSIGGKEGQRRVALVSEPIEGRKRKVHRREEFSDSEDIGRIKVGKLMSEVVLDKARHDKEGRSERSKHKKEEKKRHKEDREKRHKKTRDSGSPQKDKNANRAKKKEMNGTKPQLNVTNVEDDFMDDLPPLLNDPVLDLGMGETDEDDEPVVSPLSSQQSSNLKNNMENNIQVKQEKVDKNQLDSDKQSSRVVLSKEIKQEKETNSVKSKAANNINSKDKENSTDILRDGNPVQNSSELVEKDIIKPKVRARWDSKEKVVVTKVINPEPTIQNKLNFNDKNVDNSSTSEGKNDSLVSSLIKDSSNNDETENTNDVEDQLVNKSLSEQDKSDKSTDLEKDNKSQKTRHSNTRKSRSPDGRKSKSEKTNLSVVKETDKKRSESRSKSKSSPSKKYKGRHSKKSKSKSPVKRRNNKGSDDDKDAHSSSDNESRGSRSYSERSSSSSGTESSTGTSGTSDSDSDSSSTSGSSSGRNSDANSKSKKPKSVSSRNRHSYRRRISESNSDSEHEDKKGSSKSSSSSRKQNEKSNRDGKSREKEDKSSRSKSRGDSGRDEKKRGSASRSHSRDRKRTSDKKRRH